MKTTISAAALAGMLATVPCADAAPVCGDVNASGKVTSSDALLVLKDAVGQAVKLLCEQGSQPLQTGQTASYGAGSDGALQEGAPRSFTDNGDGTITDHVTGLMWEKKDDSNLGGTAGIHDKDNTYSWSTGTNNMDGTIVTTFLATLNSGGGFAGHTDWRVPNEFELFSLMNLAAANPSTSPAFNTGCAATCAVTTCSCTTSDGYWTSSTLLDFPNFAWGVGFNSTGGTYGNYKTSGSFVRAVRAGS